MHEGLQSEVNSQSLGSCSELPSPGNKDILNKHRQAYVKKRNISIRHISQNISQKPATKQIKLHSNQSIKRICVKVYTAIRSNFQKSLGWRINLTWNKTHYMDTGFTPKEAFSL